MKLMAFAAATALTTALAAGSAQAADDFSTLETVPSAPLSAAEMGEVVGALTLFRVTSTSTTGSNTLSLSETTLSTSSSRDLGIGLTAPHKVCPAPSTCGKAGRLTGWSSFGAGS